MENTKDEMLIGIYTAEDDVSYLTLAEWIAKDEAEQLKLMEMAKKDACK